MILAIFLTFIPVLLVSALLGCLFGVQRSRKKSYHATVKEKGRHQLILLFLFFCNFNSSLEVLPLYGNHLGGVFVAATQFA